MGEFRRVSTEFQRTLNTEIAIDEEKQKAKARKAEKAAEKAEVAQSESVAEAAPAPEASSENSNKA